MKKILIGGSVLVLFALLWVGAGEIGATAKEDVSAGEETKRYAVGSDRESTDSSQDESEDSEADSVSNLAKIISEIAERIKMVEARESTVSEEGLLYKIETSGGNNLGMVPIVNGSAVVLLDGSSASTYQGDYSPEEMSALSLKLEEKTTQATESGKIDAWAFYRESALRTFEIPAGVATIEKFAFSRSSLGSIEIPEGVTTIGYGAFYHCDALSDVTIPASVTTIEENAFSHTPWLENWMTGGVETEETPDGEEAAESSEVSDDGDFLIVGDGILLAYRGNEENPELPVGVKSVVPGAIGE